MSGKLPGIWVGQWLHFGFLLVAISVVALVWNYLGEPSPVLFWMAVAIPLVHQIYVWLAWRLQLQSSVVTKTLGFRGYAVIFFVLFCSRFVSLAALGWSDRASLELPTTIQLVLTVLLATPALYAGYSVQRYFGLVRAAGADHFDPHYREMNLVKEGIFRFTDNGMYFYAFLSFWAIAVACNSSAALTVAAFSHAYIWIHFYATERPDMRFLYGGNEAPTQPFPRT